MDCKKLCWSLNVPYAGFIEFCRRDNCGVTAKVSYAIPASCSVNWREKIQPVIQKLKQFVHNKTKVILRIARHFSTNIAYSH